MMGLRMPDVRHLSTYAEAAARFDMAKERTTNTYGRSGTHAMPRHNAHFTGLSKDRDGTICFVYHSTKVVLWHPDNTCTLDLSYGSQSTVTFADRFGPRGLCIYGAGKVLRVHTDGVEAFYQHRGRVRFDVHGQLTHPGEDTTPINRKRVDRKAAKIASKESGLDEFLAWYKPMAALLGWEQMHTEDHYMSDVVTSLRIREHWESLRTSRHIAGCRADVPAVVQALRKAVYEQYGAYYTEEHASAPSYGSFTAWTST